MTDIKAGHTGTLIDGAESTSGYRLGNAEFKVIRPPRYAEFDAKVLSGPRRGYDHTISISMVAHWDHELDASQVGSLARILYDRPSGSSLYTGDTVRIAADMGGDTWTVDFVSGKGESRGDPWWVQTGDFEVIAGTHEEQTPKMVVGGVYGLIPGATNYYGRRLEAMQAQIVRPPSATSENCWEAKMLDGPLRSVIKYVAENQFDSPHAPASATYARPVVPADTDSVDVFDMLTTMGG